MYDTGMFSPKNKKRVRIAFTVVGILLIISMVLTYSGVAAL